jgi:hypothetical protein
VSVLVVAGTGTGTRQDGGEVADARHIVYSSFLNAAPDATFTWARDHYATG